VSSATAGLLDFAAGASGSNNVGVPRIESTLQLPVSLEEAFALSQSQGDVRYAWDPFVREQRLLHGATHPDKGVQTFTRSRHGLRMVSEYTSFRPPTQVGMKMVSGPPFFSAFGGGWTFRTVDGATGPVTEATWRYTFTIRPSWLAPVADPIGRWLLGRDIDGRLRDFAAGCADADLVARAVEALRSAPPATE